MKKHGKLRLCVFFFTLIRLRMGKIGPDQRTGWKINKNAIG
jgi:hypothetical protein